MVMKLKMPTGEFEPFLAMNGNDGSFELADGADATSKRSVDLIGKPLFVDIAGAVQGWLHVDVGVYDWQPLSNPESWGEAPSNKHSPGVSVMVRSPAFGSDNYFVFRKNSGAHNRLVQEISDKTADDAIKNNKIPVIRLEKAISRSTTKGGTVDFEIEVGPPERWLDRPAEAPKASAPSDAGGEDTSKAVEADSWG